MAATEVALSTTIPHQQPQFYPEGYEPLHTRKVVPTYGEARSGRTIDPSMLEALTPPLDINESKRRYDEIMRPAPLTLFFSAITEAITLKSIRAAAKVRREEARRKRDFKRRDKLGLGEVKIQESRNHITLSSDQPVRKKNIGPSDRGSRGLFGPLMGATNRRSYSKLITDSSKLGQNHIVTHGQGTAVRIKNTSQTSNSFNGVGDTVGNTGMKAKNSPAYGGGIAAARASASQIPMPRINNVTTNIEDIVEIGFTEELTLKLLNEPATFIIGRSLTAEGKELASKLAWELKDKSIEELHVYFEEYSNKFDKIANSWLYQKNKFDSNKAKAIFARRAFTSIKSSILARRQDSIRKSEQNETFTKSDTPTRLRVAIFGAVMKLSKLSSYFIL